MAEPAKNLLEKLSDQLWSWEAGFDQLRQHVGWPAAALVVILVLGGLFWWKWDEILKRPFVKQLVEFLLRRPIARVPADGLNIAVAHLENDKDREQEKLLLDELRHFEGVRTSTVDRTVEWPTSGATETVNAEKAKEKAQRLLKKKGADVLIWGSVLSASNTKAMRLYWTSAQELRGAKATERYQFETLALPALFWDDLKQVLGLLAGSRISALTFGETGRFIADKLTSLIAQVRALVERRPGTWDPETLASVQFSLAAALRVQGEQSGSTDKLVEGIQYYRKVLVHWTSARAPLQWAEAQTNLGNALFNLGQRKGETARLEEAVEAFRGALDEGTRARVPLDRATIQNSLGAALKSLGQALLLRGEWEGGKSRLEEAVAACREALEGWNRAREPLYWAETQTNLGAALTRLGGVLIDLGEPKSGAERLEEGIAAYKQALQEFTRARAPLYWAAATNNLGAALTSLGEQERGTARLKEAVEAFREALKENTRARLPFQWAETQDNLGNALMRLGAREKGTARLEQAVAAYHEALQEFRGVQLPIGTN